MALLGVVILVRADEVIEWGSLFAAVACQQDGAHGLGAVGPWGHISGACAWQRRRSLVDGRMWVSTCVHELQGWWRHWCERSRPSIGKPDFGSCAERARESVWDRSADHIRASGQNGRLQRPDTWLTRTLRW